MGLLPFKRKTQDLPASTNLPPMVNQRQVETATGWGEGGDPSSLPAGAVAGPTNPGLPPMVNQRQVETATGWGEGGDPAGLTPSLASTTTHNDTLAARPDVVDAPKTIVVHHDEESVVPDAHPAAAGAPALASQTPASSNIAASQPSTSSASDNGTWYQAQHPVSAPEVVSEHGAPSLTSDLPSAASELVSEHGASHLAAPTSDRLVASAAHVVNSGSEVVSEHGASSITVNHLATPHVASAPELVSEHGSATPLADSRVPAFMPPGLNNSPKAHADALSSEEIGPNAEAWNKPVSSLSPTPVAPSAPATPAAPTLAETVFPSTANGLVPSANDSALPIKDNLTLPPVNPNDIKAGGAFAGLDPSSSTGTVHGFGRQADY